MKIFGISDLHLAKSVEDKNMDLFGPVWEGYMEKISLNWQQLVAPGDLVVIPGDISWAMKIEEAYEDFNFINQLPGRKIILKGNHDYWWSTGNKLKNFAITNKLDTVSFLHNSCQLVEELNTAICGTRGWKNPWDANFSREDQKIYQREVMRLEMSLKAGRDSGAGKIIAALHYPPFLPDDPKQEENPLLQLLMQYGVETCIFGHIHASGEKEREKWSSFIGSPRKICGIDFYLLSCDMNAFRPVRLM